VGAVVRRGQALYEADGYPVPLWYGTRPAWRAFQLGMTDGADVRQLETNLVTLGYDPNRAITVDRHYSWATAAAVKRWQKATGRAQTGAVPLGQVAFLPGPMRVATVTATVGAPLPAGTAILTVTSTRPQVTVALETAMQKLVRRGVPLKALSYGKVEPAAGSTVRQHVEIQQGIPQEKAKDIVKAIKDSKAKVQASIQGDMVRVSGKDRDTLQTVIANLKAKDFGINMQFTNYRSN